MLTRMMHATKLIGKKESYYLNAKTFETNFFPTQKSNEIPFHNNSCIILYRFSLVRQFTENVCS